MFYKIILISAIILTIDFSIQAQTNGNDVQNRIKELESQVQTILAELDNLKKTTAATIPAKTENATTGELPEKEIAPERKIEQEKKAIGIDLGNGVRAVPYGTIYFNLFGNSAGTNNSDIPLFATPTGKGNMSASVRQTRLGLRIEGLKVGKANLTGVIETDFYGGTPAIGIGENFGVVRVRLANARLDWEKTSVTVGQDWIPFAPNSPISLADAAIPQFAAAGNNWARLPQVKIERRFVGGNVVWQGAVLAPQTGDSAAAASFLQQPNSGALSRVPFFQTRLAFNQKDWLATKKPGSIGVSGHYGRSRVSSTTAPIVEFDIDSYGVALDWNTPLHRRVSWSGEVFYGQNLAGLQGGVFQGSNTDFAIRQNNAFAAAGVKGIRTAGGWTQIGLTPNWNEDKLTLYGSIGIDDPNNQDLINSRSRDFRSRNLAWAFDAIYRFRPQFQLGLEFRRLNTYYLISGRKRANHVNLAAAYSF
jgi:hypothetical protein